jgi:fatty acid desaturase
MPSDRSDKVSGCDVSSATALVALVVYAGWAALTWQYHALPAWLILPLAAALMALHGSLQHEAIHGHPTGSRSLDDLIAGVPLSLWLPYSLYRESHLAHHACGRLTDPVEDPESFYVASERWQRMSSPWRALFWINSTLAGRLLLGPAIAMLRFFAGECRRERRHGRAWLLHAVAVAPVLAWVTIACDIPLHSYVMLFVYPGLSLTLLRSFSEHRPAEGNARSTAIVEAGPVFSLLYLNNNLHALHHESPGLPWYALPEIYRAQRDEIRAKNGAFVFSGYGELAARFALRPKDVPVHPRRGEP